ncbi:MAG: transcriptional repressor [Deltaproteobacteria bacterium]|nr:transcriptional repressor [Deltaproteobacteria bacterium]
MKKHKDLLAILRHNNMRITPARRLLLQYILDNQSSGISLRNIYAYMNERLPGIDRSSIYRNLENLKHIEIIQELNLPTVGKQFQYIFDKKVHHYYICKSCGKLNKGNKTLFEKIESALKEVHGFKKANLSVIFYGHCASCSKKKKVLFYCTENLGK